MHEHLTTEQELQLLDRTHALTRMMLSTPGLIERVQAGSETAERGDTVTLEELDRELGWND